jgi:galactose oxidase
MFPISLQSLALTSLLLLQITATITECPNAETTSISATGAKFALCPNTDFQGPSAQVLKNIATLATCVQQCDNNGACINAVYDRAGKICHIKANAGQLNWVPNTKFDVVRLRNTIPEFENIAQCSTTETAFTGSGKKYTLCRGTDLQGATVQQIKGVTTALSCAQLCSTRAACTKAAWDSIKNICHIKSPEPASTLMWIMSKSFTVIHLSVPFKPSVTGQWSNLIRLPIIPVAGYVVPAYPSSSRILLFSSWSADAFGGASGLTQFADYNFNTGVSSQRQVANTKHDMFCPGISTLEDGKVLISGGSDAAAVSIYDPATNAFTRGPDMKIARGYQTSVTTSEGKIFEIGGSYSGGRGGKNGEVYSPKTNTWTLLPGATSGPGLTTYDREGIWRTDNHFWLFGWKNGSVFQAGPSRKQHWYGTTGIGSVKEAGTRDAENDAMCGINVMYDATAGKILTAGGSQSYTESPAIARAHITTIGEPNTPAKVERVPDMTFPRGFANAVVLPNGEVLVTGGQRKSMVFTDTDGILVPELFNPGTKTWKQLAPMAVPRNYHSISILLPDATVFTGGGGLCYVGKIGASSANCDKSVDHADGQIYSPPYLFNADGSLATRPQIIHLSTTVVNVGGELTVQIRNGDKPRMVLIRMGTVTHSVNSDQRRVPLVPVQTEWNQWKAKLPNDSGVLIPGMYYLFVVSGDGVPSLARTVKVTR